MTPQRFAAALAAALALAACGAPDPTVSERSFSAFGTITTVQLIEPDASRRARAHAAIEARYRELERDWRSFGPGELGRVNARLAHGERARLSPALRALVVRSLEIKERSGGFFDPRVGGLVALWGFHDLGEKTPVTPPDPAAVDELRDASINRAELRVEGDDLVTTAPVTLELAGIAKGAALNVGRKTLIDAGIKAALVTIGGDVIALGLHGSRPWRVGVQDPRGSGTLGTIELADGEAALSSGNYERQFATPDGRAHHILDPRTGRPTTGAAGVTVIAGDAALANAAAVALMVGGTEEFERLSAALQIESALLVAEDGGVVRSDDMAGRLARMPD